MISVVGVSPDLKEFFVIDQFNGYWLFSAVSGDLLKSDRAELNFYLRDMGWVEVHKEVDRWSDLMYVGHFLVQGEQEYETKG